MGENPSSEGFPPQKPTTEQIFSEKDRRTSKIKSAISKKIVPKPADEKLCKTVRKQGNCRFFICERAQRFSQMNSTNVRISQRRGKAHTDIIRSFAPLLHENRSALSCKLNRQFTCFRTDLQNYSLLLFCRLFYELPI